MDPLFSFVTVRNPRTPSPQEVATGFVRYDPELHAALVERFAELWRDGQGADAVRALVAEFRKTDESIDSLDDFQGDLPALADWAQWLAANALKLTWEAVRHRRGEVELAIETETRRRLWDNLIAYTYGGGDSEVREALVWALRVAHLHDYDPAKDEPDGLAQRLATATVLIPPDSHGSLERQAPAEEVPPDAPEDGEADRLRERLGRLEHLHDHLGEALERASAAGPDEEVPPPRLPTQRPDGCLETPEEPDPDPRPPAPRLTEDVISGLPEDVRGELEQVGLGPGVRLSQALQAVERKAGTVGASVWRHDDPTRAVVMVGGGFWTRAQPAAAESAAAVRAAQPRRDVGTREEEHYRGFFGTHANADDVEHPCRIRPLGVGDFRRVEQQLCCYEPGEVAHIENVLKGETKERRTRRLLSTEQLFTTVSDEETTEERDTQTTDRLELQREVSKVLEFDLSFEMGVNLAAQYGPVKIVADTKFATSLSSQESDRQASKYAKEVTDRALESVTRKVREERSTRTTTEYEENNLHQLTAPDDHVVGIYRWVDKVYEAKVVNYGKRLMFEFLVPEPAAFHLHASVATPSEGTLTLEKPLDPRSPEAATKFGRPALTSHASVTETNYGLWAAAYGVLVEPPPTLTEVIGKAYHREGMDHTVQFADSKNDLKLPEGREATWFSSVFGLHSESHSGGANWITVIVGRRSRFSTVGTTFTGALDSEDDIVPVVLMGRTKFYAINIEVECRRSAQLFATWQHKTFDAILRAYQDQLAAYNTALAAAKAGVGIAIEGSNPALNREIEQIELEKGCIRLLTRCADLPSEAMKDDGQCGYPEFDCCEAIRDGRIVQFFEQLFEWRLMTYAFYPYFWGRQCNWERIYQLEDVDPLFLQFLQAGYARVVVPIREGYERAALRFLADGALWDGGAAPGIDSPMYVAIENELKEPVGIVDPDIEPWPIRVPTELTVLQCGSGCVEGDGLPCPCEEDKEDGKDGKNGKDGKDKG